jgi:hypothetical protein
MSLILPTYLEPEEIAFIELKLALSKQLKALGIAKNISQETLAQKVKLSQARVAK